MEEKIKRALDTIGQKVPLTQGNITKLSQVEKFYESIGGIVGYHHKVLSLLKKDGKMEGVFSRPPQIPLTRKAVFAGVQALEEFGELYPLGGLGSRLGLCDHNGRSLPAATLPFLGRSLLEGLIRDVEAREYLFFKLFGKKVITPIAMMASDEEHNFPHIYELCEKARWFGRGKDNFFLFKQPSVPVITERGHWLLDGEELVCQPNGHGALWKVAKEEGVFEWFQTKGRKKLLIRQINNPIGGIDDGLLAFMGTGVLQKKTFGFASCERPKGVQEGMLVLLEKNGMQTISNIEYLDLERYGIEDLGFPANTNILFADLEKLLPIIQENPLPGLIVNQKSGSAMRLESMMQNISDAMEVPKGEPLSTFLTFNIRHRTISSAKRKYEEGKGLRSTPEGAFYDWMRNAHELLVRCGFQLPPMPSEEEYLKDGPSFAFYYVPSLGPFYSIIEQKLRGGKIARGSELVLDHPDIFLQNLELDGSLQIKGKCRLENVRVKNRGLGCCQFWKHEMERIETIEVEGNFWAEDVELAQSITVPEGEVWKLTGRGIEKALDWDYHYKLEDDKILVL